MSKNNLIIVGVDSSIYSEKALGKAIELAKLHNAGLKILHVFEGAVYAGDFKIPIAEHRNVQNLLLVDEKRVKFFEDLLTQYVEGQRMPT
jgi:nucleotide-binding universal stress UspA family protein